MPRFANVIIAGLLFLFVPIISTNAQIDFVDDNGKSPVLKENTSTIALSTSQVEQTDTTSFPKEMNDQKLMHNGKLGIGVSFGIRICDPSEFNEFLVDLWEELDNSEEEQSMFFPNTYLLPSIKVRVFFYPIPELGIESYYQFGLMGNASSYEGIGSNTYNRNFDAELKDYVTGANIWYKFRPFKTFSFKTGIGFFYDYSIINVSWYQSAVKMTGYGFGGNLMSGMDFTFRHIAVNLDFVIPIVDFPISKRTGANNGNPVSIKYPKRIVLTGIEFRPGLTILF